MLLGEQGFELILGGRPRKRRVEAEEFESDRVLPRSVSEEQRQKCETLEPADVFQCRATSLEGPTARILNRLEREVRKTTPIEGKRRAKHDGREENEGGRRRVELRDLGKDFIRNVGADRLQNLLANGHAVLVEPQYGALVVVNDLGQQTKGLSKHEETRSLGDWNSIRRGSETRS